MKVNAIDAIDTSELVKKKLTAAQKLRRKYLTMVSFLAKCLMRK